MALPAISDLRSLYVTYINEQWDDVDPNRTVHLITWNPKPRFYASLNEDGSINYDTQWCEMLNLLQHCKRCCDIYSLVAEISADGKLHMHGFYQVFDKIKYHKSFLPSLTRNGFIKHNKANSLQRKVIKYHKKDIYDTIEHLNDQSIPIVLCPQTKDELKALLLMKRCESHIPVNLKSTLRDWLPLVAPSITHSYI